MCIIAVKPKGIDLPLQKHLEQCAVRNRDGIGIMHWKKGSDEIHVKKDFKDVNELLLWMNDNVKKEDALVIHFRLATSGLKDKGNRHPFPLTRNTDLLRTTDLYCKYAMVHNGILSRYSGHKKYSDTQKFVLDVLYGDEIKRNLHKPYIRKVLGHYLDGDRMAIMKHDGTIYLFNKFHKENGVQYSNTGYEPFEWGSYNRKQIGFAFTDDEEKKPKHKWNNYKHSGYVNREKTGKTSICESCGKREWTREYVAPMNKGKFDICASCIELANNGVFFFEKKVKCALCKKEHPISDTQQFENGDVYCLDCIMGIND